MAIHRWRSTTGNFLDAGSWDSGIAPGIAATGTLTFTGNAVADETVTIDGRTYTWKAAPASTDEITIGADGEGSRDNLVTAINVGPQGGGAKHASVTATANSTDKADIEAIQLGAGGNSIDTTETMTNASFGGATLSGGLTNWATDDIASFDGEVNKNVNGMARLKNIPFILRAGRDNKARFGSSGNPLFVHLTGASGGDEQDKTHLLDGWGNDSFISFHLESPSVRLMRIGRFDSGKITLSSDTPHVADAFYLGVGGGKVIIDDPFNALLVVTGNSAIVHVTAGATSTSPVTLLSGRVILDRDVVARFEHTKIAVLGGTLELNRKFSGASFEPLVQSGGQVIYRPHEGGNDGALYVLSGLFDTSKSKYVTTPNLVIVGPHAEIEGSALDPDIRRNLVID